MLNFNNFPPNFNFKTFRQLVGLCVSGLGIYVATAAKSYEEFFGSGSVSLSYVFIGKTITY